MMERIESEVDERALLRNDQKRDRLWKTQAFARTDRVPQDKLSVRRSIPAGDDKWHAGWMTG